MTKPLDAPEEAGGILWQAFIELDGSRAFHAHGPCSNAFAEIEAWGRMKRYPLLPHHGDILWAVDSVMVSHLIEAARKAGQQTKRRPAFTPRLFDATFR